MIPLFLSNDPADWGGFASKSASYYDAAYVDFSLQLGSETMLRPMSTLHKEAVGDVTWYHMRFVSTISAGANEDGHLFEIRNASGSQIARLDQLNGVFYAQALGDAAPVGAGFTFGAGTAYFLDFKITVNASEVSVELYRDSILISSATTTNNNGKTKPRRWDLDTNDNWIGGSFYCSEIIISEADTRGARLERRDVVAAANYSAWDGAVADLGDDNTVTGMVSDITGQRASHTFEAYSNAAPIAAVVLATRAEQSGNLGNLKQFLRISATDYDGALEALSESPEVYFETWETNPDTALAWLPADVSGIEGGLLSQT